MPSKRASSAAAGVPPESGRTRCSRAGAAGSMRWMLARAAASCSGSAARAAAYSASRSSLRAMVSPATKSITNAEPSPSASAAHQRTRGTGTPAAAAVSRSVNSPARLDSMTCPGGSRRSTSGSRRPSGWCAVKSQISRDAPPASRFGPSIATSAPRRARTLAASRSARPVVGSFEESVDVIEELRPAVADATAPLPLGQAFGDSGGDAAAPVPERHHGENPARDLLRCRAVCRVQPRAQPPVQLLRSGMVALDLDASDRAVLLPVLPDVPALHLPAVPLHRQCRRDPGVGTEIHREPAVVVRRLPVARSPRAIAQPVAVDRPAPLADRDAADRVSVLLEVTACELLAGSFRADALPAPVALLPQLAAMRGRHGRAGEPDAHRHVRILGEGRAWSREIEWARDEAGVPRVGDRVLAHRHTHLEAHAAGLEAGVVGDLRAAEHEAHRPVGQVEAERHLGIALVRAVTDPDEAPEALRRVVEVVVGALVVVRLTGVLVHQVVGVETDPADGAHVDSCSTRCVPVAPCSS